MRAFEWLEGVPRECVYDNLRSVVARRERDEVHWNRRFLHLRGHYAFHATACTPATPREKGSVEAAVRYLKTGFWPARRFETLGELDARYADWRDEVANRRRHASGRFLVEARLEEERRALRELPPERFDWSAGRSGRVPLDVLHKVKRRELCAVEVTKGRRKGLRIQVSGSEAGLFAQ